MQPSDKELAQGVLHGEHVALLTSWIQQAAARIGTVEGVAPEDIVCDAMESVLVNLQTDKFNHQSSLKTYVQKITSNTVISLIRSKMVARKYVALLGAEVPHNPTPAELAETEEQLFLAQRILGLLGEPCREFLELYFRQELSYAEIAKRLGTNEQTLRVRNHRCLKKAREIGMKLL